MKNTPESNRKSAFKIVTSSKKTDHQKNMSDASELSDRNTASLILNAFRSRNSTSYESENINGSEDSILFQVISFVLLVCCKSYNCNIKKNVFIGV